MQLVHFWLHRRRACVVRFGRVAVEGLDVFIALIGYHAVGRRALCIRPPVHLRR